MNYLSRKTKLISLGVVILILILFGEHRMRQDYSDMFKVGKNFSVLLMKQSKYAVDSWTSEELKSKMSKMNLNEREIEGLEYAYYEDKDIKMVEFSRLLNDVVLTYKITVNSSDLFYTVVLTSTGRKDSMWERFRRYIQNDFPINFGLDYYRPSTKWLVSDYYTKADIRPLIEKARREVENFKNEEYRNKFLNSLDRLEFKKQDDYKISIDSYMQRLSLLLENWADREKMRQHNESKRNYQLLNEIENNQLEPFKESSGNVSSAEKGEASEIDWNDINNIDFDSPSDYYPNGERKSIEVIVEELLKMDSESNGDI